MSLLARVGVTRVHQQYTRLRSGSLSRPPELPLVEHSADDLRPLPTFLSTRIEANYPTINNLDAGVIEESGRELKKLMDGWRQDHCSP